MSWIQSHQSLERHPKTIRLMQNLKWGKDQSIGFLHKFWWWALTYAEDGDLLKYTKNDLSTYMECDINVIQVLYDIGWIDPNNLIHDWLHYAGKYLESKYRTSNPKLLRSILRKHKADLRQSQDRPKTDKIREDKIRGDKTSIYVIPELSEVIGYMNKIGGRLFRDNESTAKFLNARYREVKDVQILKDVALLKWEEWKDNIKMVDYFRPSTLFNKEKFYNYLEQLERKRARDIIKKKYEKQFSGLDWNVKKDKVRSYTDQEVEGIINNCKDKYPKSWFLHLNKELDKLKKKDDKK